MRRQLLGFAQSCRAKVVPRHEVCECKQAPHTRLGTHANSSRVRAPMARAHGFHIHGMLEFQSAQAKQVSATQTRIRRRVVGNDESAHGCTNRHVGMKAAEALQPVRARRYVPVSDVLLKRGLYVGGTRGKTKTSTELLPEFDRCSQGRPPQSHAPEGLTASKI